MQSDNESHIASCCEEVIQHPPTPTSSSSDYERTSGPKRKNIFDEYLIPKRHCNGRAVTASETTKECRTHIHTFINRYQPTNFYYRQINIPNAQQTPTPPSTPPLASFPLPDLILVRNTRQLTSSSSSSSAPLQSESTKFSSTPTRQLQ